jgi:phosphate transport system permease protein
MLPLLLGSLYVTVGALVISVPLGIACATFISEVAPRWIQEVLKPTVEVLATIPSVVFGFLGLLLIGPWLAELLNLPVPLFAALGSLMLALMAIPTIVSVSEDAIRAVPMALRENSLALGATRWQTISRVVLPAARSGIIAAVLLGLGRAIGETMTVLMVTGNAAVLPAGVQGFMRPVRTLTATIAAEMGETAYATPHYHALFTIGLMLFLITFATNTIADIAVRRGRVLTR